MSNCFVECERSDLRIDEDDTDLNGAVRLRQVDWVGHFDFEEEFQWWVFFVGLTWRRLAATYTSSSIVLKGSV
jgi:hypothetical protein